MRRRNKPSQPDKKPMLWLLGSGVTLEDNVNRTRMIKALSIMWGFAGGGISHYVASIDKMNRLEDVRLSHVIIRNPKWRVHLDLWNQLTPYEIVIRSRLDGAWVPELMRIIQKLDPHVILVHGFNGFLVAGICRCLMMNIPIVATYHGTYFPFSMLRRMVSGIVNRYAYFFMKHLAKYVIVVSQSERNSLIMKGVDIKKIVVIYNGIPDDEAIEYDSRKLFHDLEVPKDAFVVGATSSFHPVKGLSFLLEAIHDVIVYCPDVHLVLFGKGKLKRELQKLCNALNIEQNVRFAGFFDDVERYLPSFDMFVLPSLSEAHSIGLLEAMRAASAIICTGVGGNRETIRNGEDGIVVEPGDSNGLRDAIVMLIENDNLRRSMAASARNRFLEHYTEERMLQETLYSLKKCVSTC